MAPTFFHLVHFFYVSISQIFSRIYNKIAPGTPIIFNYSVLLNEVRSFGQCIKKAHNETFIILSLLLLNLQETINKAINNVLPVLLCC